MKQVFKKMFASVLVAIMLLTTTVLPESLSLLAKASWYEYSAWSSWSAWQDTAVTETELRDVETQEVVASTNYKTVYHYYRYASSEGASSGSYAQSSSYPNKYTYSFDSELSTADPLNGHTRYKYWYSSSNWRGVYADSPYTTQEVVSYNYKTQYRYRTRTKIWYYSIAYNANGGTGAPATQTKTGGKALTLSSTVPTKKFTITYNANGGSVSSTSKAVSCTFKNWKATNGSTYSKGGSYTADADTTMTAQWTNPTAGTLATPTRTGYAFKGWFTAASGGTKVTSSTTISANTTIYAQWTANTLGVYYNANGGSIESDTYYLSSGDVYKTADSVKFCQNWTYNSAQTYGLGNADSFGLYRTGYTFSTWGTSTTGGTLFDQNDTSITPTDLNPDIVSGNKTMTVYAQWTPNTYSVKFDGNGNTAGSMSDVACTYNVEYTLPSNSYSKTHYIFNGWNTQPDGLGTSYPAGASVKNLTSENNGEVTLYAQWLLNEYIVSYDANGGYGAPASQNKIAGEDLILSSQIPTKHFAIKYEYNGGTPAITGRRVFSEFEGWKATDGSIYSAGASYTVDEDTVLTAQWNDNVLVDVLDTPSRPGYTFNGWYISEIGGRLITAPVILNPDTILYARWTANKLIVSFNANGGTCEVSNKIVAYGSVYGTLPVPTRPGYKFLGWYATTSNGWNENTLNGSTTSTDVFTEDTVVSKVSDHTLYAHWEEKPVTAISVDLTETKTTYYIGDTFDASNIALTVTCEDGESFNITTGFECSEPTLDKVCQKRVTVTYKGFIVYFIIDVVMAPLKSISVKNQPDNLLYSLGDSINTKGLVLQATYTNGYSKELTTGYETNYDFTSSGNKTVVVSYTENDITVTTSYGVTVEDVPLINSDVISAYCGEIVSVPVYISNNSGIMGFGIEVSYDESILTPVSVTAGSAISGFLDNSISTSDTNSFMVYWTGSENMSEDDLLFTIDFLVADNAYGECKIGLNYSSDDTFDEDWNDVKLICNNITLNVSEKDSNATKIIADNCSGKIGTTIAIPVKVIQNNGLDASTVSIGYDNAVLTPILVSSGMATVSKSYVGTGYNSYNFDINEVSETAGEGTLLTVKFTIDDCAPGEYEVTLSSSDPSVKGGAFIIKVLPEDTKIYGGEIVKDGDIITVPVNISGNYGMMGLRLNFTYDASVMEPISATAGDVITTGMTEETIGVSPAGTLSFIWIGNDDITGNGELLLLKFKMLSGTTGSKISIDYSVPDTYNSSWENVDLLCEDVSVVYEIIPEGNTFINFVNNFIITKEVEKTSVFGFLKPSVGFEFIGLPSHMAGINQFFGTGSLIYVYKNGAPQYPLTLVVEGDVNGDSVCDALDAAQVALVSNDQKTIDGAYKMAADNNYDDIVDIEDYQAIVNKVVS